MGLVEEYKNSRNKLFELGAVWNPKLKAIVFRSGVVVYLGGDPQAPPLAFKLLEVFPSGYSSPPTVWKLSKYAVTGKLPKEVTMIPLEPEDVLEESEPEVGLRLLETIPEPYRAKLMAWLLPRT